MTPAATELPTVKLNQGIHVMHLFYRVDRGHWEQLSRTESDQIRMRVQNFCSAHAAASHPRVTVYANICGKADLAFLLQAAELGQLAQMHRDLEQCFPAATLERVFSYLSVT